MQFRAIALSSFVAAAAAQNSTDSSLTDLVSQLPPCAIPCFEKGADAVNCSTTDFECLCTNSEDFAKSAAVCIFTSSCSSEDQSKASNLATEICTDVNNGNVTDSDQAAASSIVSSALTAAATDMPDDAAVRPEMGYGVFGAAAVAAMWAL